MQYSDIQFLLYTTKSRLRLDKEQVGAQDFTSRVETEDLHIEKWWVHDASVRWMIESKNKNKTSMWIDWKESSSDSILEQDELDPFKAVRTFYDWPKSIINAKSKETIIAVLRFKSETIADRLQYLKEITEDESGETPIEIESLRRSAIFIMENPQLPNPQITISGDGLVYLRWSLKNKGVLGVQFLPSSPVRFTAIVDTPHPGSQRWSVSGVLQPSDMMNAIKPFTEQLLQS